MTKIHAGAANRFRHLGVLSIPVKYCSIIALFAVPFGLFGQTIGDFTSIRPGPQYQYFILPVTHTYQVLVQAGDYIGNGLYMRETPDYTAFIANDTSNTAGMISVSHESAEGGVTIFDIAYDDSLKRWNPTNPSEIDFSGVERTTKNCSGGITPWGTLITAEELVLQGDSNGDGYFDTGWLTEIDPWSREIVDQDGDGDPDKLWRMGCMRHENICISDDGSTCYYGSDAVPGHVFKFVATTPGDLSEGDTYVLRKPSLLSPGGEWLYMPEDSAWWLNNMENIATDSLASDYPGVEDVEIGPDGYIYFATKYSGRIYRFIDQGNSVTNFEVYVESTDYPIDYGFGVSMEPWATGSDNLAFDGEGNLWMLQDGSRNYIWMIGPGHTAAKPKIELFGRTPYGCEPTGINFSADYKFLFMSFQHPSANNWQIVVDGVGQQVVFNRGTTIVISLDENLGLGDGPPDNPDPVDTGITEFSVYPNPSKGTTLELSFFSSEPQELYIEVYGMDGRKDHAATLRSTPGWNTMPWKAPVASGVYSVVIYDANFDVLKSTRIVVVRD
jgi:hypothetical protein